ncbi:MAG: acireductone synthase [Bacteroidetes bacterium]|nr:acireductone synthase [Bacteroidota bacterium]
MNFSKVKYVLTDIEGTTTSVDFVYQILFPYFTERIDQLKLLIESATVKNSFLEVIEIAKEEGIELQTNADIIEQLKLWSAEDRKITPLKTLQGVMWRKGYESGEIKGHVYPDVVPKLIEWTKKDLQIGVFSSGSVEAQKLIFGFSEQGDLTPYFSNYFDTKTGHKREANTYSLIAEELNISANQILFLSDIKEELEAAAKAGFQTCQLVREKNTVSWPTHVSSFNEISIEL